MEGWTSRLYRGKRFVRQLPMIIWRVESVPTEFMALGKKLENRAIICVCQIQLDTSEKRL